jgi:hypothetical protein
MTTEVLFTALHVVLDRIEAKLALLCDGAAHKAAA